MLPSSGLWALESIELTFLSLFNGTRTEGEYCGLARNNTTKHRKENFTFAEHCNLDAEITALLMTCIMCMAIANHIFTQCWSYVNR